MNKVFKISLAVAALSLAFTASASPRFGKHAGQGPSYDNIGLSYVNVDADSGLPNFDGFGVGLEKRLTTNWYASAVYSKVENKDAFTVMTDMGDADIPAGVIDLETYVMGLGYIAPLTQTTTLDIFAGFAKEKFSFAGDQMSEYGFQVGISLRQRVGELEWRISPTYRDLGAEMDTFAVTLAGAYYIAPSFTLDAGVTIAEESNGIAFGVRYHF